MLSIAGKTRKDVDAAGFSRTEFPTLRHEGKLTALAAHGQSILADKIAALFLLMEMAVSLPTLVIIRRW